MHYCTVIFFFKCPHKQCGQQAGVGEGEPAP